jgi:choline dehydrogenase-like flavoprotein
MAERDVIVIGAGLGGSFAALRLAERGLKVMVLESGDLSEAPMLKGGVFARIGRKLRGGAQPAGPQWPETITRYQRDRAGRTRRIWPVLGRGPGGSSALYFGALGRFRREDLNGWPIGFDEMRDYYRAAESVMRLVGERDPLDEDDDSDSAVPPPMSARDQMIVADLTRAGMHPYRLRVGIGYLPGCNECLGRRCPRLCKADGYSRALVPGLATGRIALELGVSVTEILRVGTKWQVVGRDQDGLVRKHLVRNVIVASGAWNTPLLLDRSEGLWRARARPEMMGRGLVFHLSDLIVVLPRRGARLAETTGPSKTIAFRDLYGGEDGIGEVHSYGPRVNTGMMMNGLRARLDDMGLHWIGVAAELARPLAWLCAQILKSAVVFATIQPDPPLDENRVWEEVVPAAASSQRNGRPRIAFNYTAPPELRARSRRMRGRLAAAFAPNRILFPFPAGLPNLGHAMGTCRMGSDPAHSVVDPHGQVWGHPGLYVGDTSVFPSSGGAGPSLTVAALGLRLGDHLANLLIQQDPRSFTAAP